jgi:glycine/D-amino acid oxidase-like deaminating enzyme
MTQHATSNTQRLAPDTRHPTPKTVVIGAGIVGAAIALRLAEKGAAVILLDRARPASGATAASFARVTATGNRSRAYLKLGEAAMREYHRLAWRLAPAPWYHVDGTLAWFRDPERAAAQEERVRQLRDWGYAAEMLPARTVLAELEPGLAIADMAASVAWFAQEAWVDGVAMTRRLVEGVRNAGGRVLTGPERAVVAIGMEAGRVASVTLAGGQTIPVRTVVNAAGVDAPRIAGFVGRALAVAAPRGLGVRAAMPDGSDPLRRPVRTDDVAVRPDGPGHLFLVPAENLDTVPPGPLPLDDAAVVTTLSRGAALAPALALARPVAALVAPWPFLADDLPSVGAVPAIPGYYEAVTDYGVTLAPLIGRSLGDEILGLAPDPLFAPFRPDRQTQT